MIEASQNMIEHKIRVFFAAFVCAFTMLGLTSCALFPLSSKPIMEEQQVKSKEVVEKIEDKKEQVKEAVIKQKADKTKEVEKIIVIPKVDKTIKIVKNTPADPLILDYSFNAVWLASLKAVKQVGLIKDQEMMSGHIIARIRSAIVDINIEKIDAKQVRLKVSAIKDAGKDDDLAADIFQRIQKLAALY